MYRGQSGQFRGQGRGGYAQESRGGSRGGSGNRDRGGRGRGGFRGGSGPRGNGRGGNVQAQLFRNGVHESPNAELQKIENAMVKRDHSTALAMISLRDEPPRRPDYGTKGRPITLHTNYFELKGVGADTTLYLYSVAFSPDKDLSKWRKKRLIEILLDAEPFAGLAIATDGSQTLVAPKKIPMGAERREYKLEWFPTDGTQLPPETPDESDKRKEARKKNSYKALVQAVRTVSLSDLVKDLTYFEFTYSLKLETIQALNIIMACCSDKNLNIKTMGGNKFFPIGTHPQKESYDLASGYEALRGYYSSVRTSVGRIMVNVNVATSAFYKSGKLLDIMQEVVGTRILRGVEQQKKAAAFFCRLRFKTNYGTTSKIHTISDVSPYHENGLNTFIEVAEPNGRMTKLTVQDYFRKKYKCELREPYAPLIVCTRAGLPQYYPAELCEIMPGQPVRGLLSGSQTSEMIKFAARKPHQNAESIASNGLEIVQIKPFVNGSNTQLSPFGITVSPNFLTVFGRILDTPYVRYRSGPLRPSNGAWNLTPGLVGPNPFVDARELTAWNTLVLEPERHPTFPGGRGQIRDLLTEFSVALRAYGLKPGHIQDPVIVNVTQGNLARIHQEIQLAMRSFRAKPKFLFVLLPPSDVVLYDCIKYMCDCQFGIPSVCCVGRKILKPQGQRDFFANLAMKFNFKLGGVNHAVDLEDAAHLDKMTIVFGIDVTHPSPGSAESAPSIARVVASFDHRFCQYPASIRTQRGRQEMVAELKDMVIERLQLWRRRNRSALPNKVIVYRDGVSEGQYRTVLDEEYPAFKQAFMELYGEEKRHPKITIIIVGKRHHTRFYPTKREEMDGRTGNPLPGTVVDRGVTGEKMFDFFLQPHQGLQGTARPAHYVVLKDEIKFGADGIQQLTHKLCYMQARATRSVSVCPPAFYADRVCERGRCYLHRVLKEGSADFSQQMWQKDVHPALQETMFYL